MVGSRCIVLILGIFAVVTASKTATQLQWKNCDQNAPVLINALSVTPHPISINKGAILKVKATLNIKYTVSMKIEKSFLSWWPTVPCVMGAGSCDYNIGVKEIPEQTIKIPDISVPAFLSDGKYRVRADIKENGTDRRLFCVMASFELDS